MEETYLSLDDVNKLLPDELSIVDRLERSLYSNKSGNPMVVCCSKYYMKDSSFWYSITTDYYVGKGVDIFCLVAGQEGILLISKEILLKYCQHSGWKKQKKGRSYYVRVRLQNEDQFVLFNSENESIDISHQFIKNTI